MRSTIVTGTDQYRHLPLAGFQADAPWRAPFLSLLNRLNRRLSFASRPLRLSIHPGDLSLYLGGLLSDWLERIDRACCYRELFVRSSADRPDWLMR